MPTDRPLWLRHPLAILADGDAGGGIVVAGGRIVELVPAGRQPSAADPLRVRRLRRTSSCRA